MAINYTEEITTHLSIAQKIQAVWVLGLKFRFICGDTLCEEIVDLTRVVAKLQVSRGRTIMSGHNWSKISTYCKVGFPFQLRNMYKV